MQQTISEFRAAAGLTTAEFEQHVAAALQAAQGHPPSGVRMVDVAVNGVSAATLGIITVQADAELRIKGIRLGPAEYPKWAASDVETHDFYWHREASVYQHQELLRTASPLRFPTAHLVADLPDRKVALIFMESVPGATGQDLTLRRNALAVRHLGQAQGEYALRLALGDAALGAQPWLAPSWLEAYCERSEQYEMTHRDNLAARQHPLMEGFRSTALDERMLAVWRGRAELLVALRTGPRTIAHNDLWPRQYLAADKPGGSASTVLLDPAYLGPAPLGLDAGNLATELCAGRPGGADRARWRDVASLLCDSYLLGLADAGLDTDDIALRRAVRLGFAGGQAARNGYRIGEWLRVAAGVTKGVATQHQWADMAVRDEREAFAVYTAYGETIVDYDREAREILRALEDADTGVDLLGRAERGAVDAARQVVDRFRR